MTEKITELTPEQWDRIDWWYRQGLKEGYATGPRERGPLEERIHHFVELLAEKRIPEIIWFKSPAAAEDFIAECGRSPNQDRWASMLLNWDFYWLVHTRALDELLPDVITPEEKRLLTATDILKEVTMLYVYENAILAVDLPTELHVNEEGRLSNLNGPALAWGDDFALWYVDGVEVKKEYVIDSANSLTVDIVRGEQNAETRRALMLLYGSRRYLKDVGAKLIDRTAHEALFRLEDGTQIMIANDHSTNRVYTLDAPPEAKSVKEVETALYGIPFENLLERS